MRDRSYRRHQAWRFKAALVRAAREAFERDGIGGLISNYYEREARLRDGEVGYVELDWTYLGVVRRRLRTERAAEATVEELDSPVPFAPPRVRAPLHRISYRKRYRPLMLVAGAFGRLVVVGLRSVADDEEVDLMGDE